MLAMLVTFDVSINGIVVSAEQPLNMDPMLVTFDVSSGGIVVNAEQPLNIELILVLLLISI